MTRPAATAPPPPGALDPKQRRAGHLAAADALARGTMRELDGDFYLKGEHGTLGVAGALMADLQACGLAAIETMPGAGPVARLTDAGRALLAADDARHARFKAP